MTSGVSLKPHPSYQNKKRESTSVARTQYKYCWPTSRDASQKRSHVPKPSNPRWQELVQYFGNRCFIECVNRGSATQTSHQTSPNLRHCTNLHTQIWPEPPGRLADTCHSLHPPLSGGDSPTSTKCCQSLYFSEYAVHVELNQAKKHIMKPHEFAQHGRSTEYIETILPTLHIHAFKNSIQRGVNFRLSSQAQGFLGNAETPQNTRPFFNFCAGG